MRGLAVWRGSSLWRALPLGVELRRAPMLRALPGLILAGMLVVTAQRAKGDGRWPDAVAALNTSLILLGPLAAGVAAWSGRRERVRRLRGWRVLAARRPSAVLALQLAAAVVWVEVALSVLLAVAAIQVERLSTWGHPPLWWVLKVYAGSVVFVVVGFVLGHRFPERFVPPLTALGAYLVLGVVELYGGNVWVVEALSPLPGSRGDIWREFNDRLALGQALWLGGGALAVASVWALVVDRAGGCGAVGWPRLLGVVVSVCATVGGMAVIVGEDGRVYLDEPVAYTAVCEGGHPAVCVHPAFTGVIPEVRVHTRALYERLRGTAGEFDTLVQSWAAGAPPIGRGRRVSFAMQAPGEAGARRVARDLVIQSFGPVCPASVAATGGPAAATASRASAATAGLLEELVEQWLASPEASTSRAAPGPAGTPPSLRAPVERFEALGETARRAWFRAHYASFAACTLTPADLAPTDPALAAAAPAG